MGNYRRARIAGGTYFFTVVTAERRPWLGTEVGRNAFREAYRQVLVTQPFTTVAGVLLLDHVHCIWQLPDGDSDFPRRWQRIKRHATEQLKARGMTTPLWQPRFWEHAIEDEDDLRRHIEYVHYNPVKHGLARRASEWGPSSIHRYIRAGVYAPDWATEDPQALERSIPGSSADT